MEKLSFLFILSPAVAIEWVTDYLYENTVIREDYAKNVVFSKIRRFQKPGFTGDSGCKGRLFQGLLCHKGAVVVAEELLHEVYDGYIICAANNMY